MEAKKIDEMPEWAKKYLYSMRLYGQLEIPFDKYIGLYRFVVIDDTVYYDDTEAFCRRMMYFYQNAIRLGSVQKVTIPNAIIKNGYILKNRYGHTSF